MATATGVAAVLFSSSSVGLASVLIATSINLAIGAVAGKLLGTKPDITASNESLRQTVRSNVLPRRVVYGEAITNGPYVMIETGGQTSQFFRSIIPLAMHPIEDVIGVFVDNDYIDVNGPGGGINTGTNDLDVSYYVTNDEYLDNDGNATARLIKNLGFGWATKAYVNDETRQEVLDDQTRAGSINSITQTVWNQPSAASRDPVTGLYAEGHKLTNCAYMFSEFEFNTDVYSGIPAQKFHVKGKRVYNPAKDDTHAAFGGSGTQRLDNPDTWEYTENWAACCLDYLINKEYGLGAKTDGPLTEIDWESMVQACLDSDDIIDNGYSGPAAGTAPRHTMNGVFEVGSTPISTMEALLATANGELVYKQGKYALYAGKYRAPSSRQDIINEDMIVSPLAIRTHTPRADLFNKVAGVYVQKFDQNGNPLFESTDFPLVDPLDGGGNNPYEVIDGEEIIEEIDLPFCGYEFEAQRTAKQQLERVRRGLTISFVANLEVLKYSVGDTIYLEILSDSKYANEAFFNKLGLDDTVQNTPDEPVIAYYKQFKITEMAYAGDFTIQVTLLENAEEIYDWNGGDAVQPQEPLLSDFSLKKSSEPVLAPTFVMSGSENTIDEVISASVGSTITTLVRWEGVDQGVLPEGLDRTHVAYYSMEYGIVTTPGAGTPEARVDIWRPAGSRRSDLDTTVQGPIALESLYKGTAISYDFRIRAISYTGKASDWAYYSVEIGSDYTPGPLIPTAARVIDSAAWTVPIQVNMGPWKNISNINNLDVLSSLQGPFGQYPKVLDFHGDNTSTQTMAQIWGKFIIDNQQSIIAYQWVQRKTSATTNGLFAGWTGQNPPDRVETFAGVSSNNPYAISAGQIANMTVGKWYLLVMTVSANSASTAPGISGIYDPLDASAPISGGGGSEYRWKSDVNGLEGWVRYLLNNATAYSPSDGFYLTQPVVYRVDGSEPSIETILNLASTPGADGDSVAVIYGYKRSASAPVDDPDAVTYDFTTGLWTPSPQNGWYNEPPSGTDDLYIVAATAKSNTNTDAIGAGEWSSPVLLGQQGSQGDPGAAGLNSATVNVYQRTDTSVAPPVPTAVTGTSVTYDFNNGTLDALENNWTKTLPTGTGKYLWLSFATAAATTATDEINDGEWSTPELLTIDGSSVGAALNVNRRTDSLDNWFVDVIQSTTLAQSSGWSIFTGGGATFNSGIEYTESTAVNRRMFSERMPVDDTKRYRVTLHASQSSGDGVNYIAVEFYDANGNSIVGGTNGTPGWSLGTHHYALVTGQQFPATRTQYQFEFGAQETREIPSQAKFFAIGVLTLWNATVSSTIRIDDYFVREIALDGAQGDPGDPGQDGLTYIPDFGAGKIGGQSDAIFSINEVIGGTTNPGEIRVQGTVFNHPDGTEYALSAADQEIDTPFEGGARTGKFYIIFSVDDPGGVTRFNDQANFTCPDFFCAIESGGTWTAIANNNVNNQTFTPLATDCIVGVGFADSTDITTYVSLVGPASGSKQAILNAYKRAYNEPADDPGTLTYTFATGDWTPANGWSKTVPTTGNGSLWAVSATALSREATDQIDSNEWSAPALVTDAVASGTSSLVSGRNPVTLSEYYGPNQSGVDKTAFGIFAASGAGYIWPGVLRCTDNDTAVEWVHTSRTEYDPNKRYEISFLMRQTSGDRRQYIGVAFQDSNGNNISSATDAGSGGWVGTGGTHHYILANTIVPSTWTRYTAILSPDDLIGPTSPQAVTMNLVWGAHVDGSTSSVAELQDAYIQEVPQARNVTTVYLYKRSYSKDAVPTKPTSPDPATYNFTTGVLSAMNNGWTQEKQFTGEPYQWVTFATASSQTNTDSIPASEWSTPVLETTTPNPGGVSLVPGRQSNDLSVWYSQPTQDVALASNVSVVSQTGLIWPNSLEINYSGGGSINLWSERTPCDPNKRYRSSLIFQDVTGSTKRHYFLVSFYDSTGAVITGAGTENWSPGSHWYWGLVDQVAPDTNANRYELEFGPGTGYPIPSNATAMAVGGLFARTELVTGQFRVHDYHLVELGEAALTVELSKPSVTIQCNSSGVPKSGAFNNASGTITVYSGQYDITEECTFSATQSNVTGTVSDTPGTKGDYSISAISSDEGYLEITVTYGSVSVKKRFTATKARDGQAALSVDTTTIADVTVTTYPTTGQSAMLTLNVGPDGTISVAATVTYENTVTTGASVTVTGKVQYREVGTTPWTDVPSSEATGGPAFWSGGFPEIGALTINQTMAGPVGVQDQYEFQLVMKKSGTGNADVINPDSVFSAGWNS